MLYMAPVLAGFRRTGGKTGKRAEVDGTIRLE
jgi:hypothetical protein